MYDFIYKRKRLVQLILAMITLPFAFFGLDYYFRSDTGPAGEVATVAGEHITQAEFSDSLRAQQERLRQAMQGNFDPTIFDNPEVRYSVLDQLIGRRLLQKEARVGRLTVSDDQVRQFISDIPAFQEGGKFSQARYEQLLDMQTPRKTPVEFADDVRRELMLAPLPGAASSVTSDCSTSSVRSRSRRPTRSPISRTSRSTMRRSRPSTTRIRPRCRNPMK